VSKTILELEDPAVVHTLAAEDEEDMQSGADNTGVVADATPGCDEEGGAGGEGEESIDAADATITSAKEDDNDDALR
jgi:hypothetical protein